MIDVGKACLDLKNSEGQKVGAVCVTLSKVGKGKRDLIYMKVNGGALSARSNTELVNILIKEKIPYEERKRALDFIGERLLYLISSEKLSLLK